MNKKEQKQNTKRSLSFFYRIMLSMVIIILIIAIVFSGFSYGFATQIISEMELEIAKKNMEMIEREVNNRLSYIEQIMLSIIELDLVRNTAESPDIRNLDTNFADQLIDNKVKLILNTDKRDDGFSATIINIYMKNGYSYSTLPQSNMDYNDFFSCYEYLLSNNMISSSSYVPITWTETKSVKNSSGFLEQTLLCVRFIYNSVTMEIIGVVVVGVAEDKLNSLYNDIFPNAYIFQNNGTIISSGDSSLLGTYAVPDIVTQIKNAKTANGSITYKDTNEENTAIFWRNTYNSVYFVIPMDTSGLLTGNKSISFATRSSYVVLLAMLMGGIVAFILTRSLSKSIISLKSVVQKVYEGNLETRYLPTRNDEIAYLGLHINDMLDQIEELFAVRERDAREKNKLELQLLQSQMNPHLLYNTLNSVLLAIKSNDSRKAEQMLRKLSNFFRLSLSKGNEKISIATEIQIVKDYIAIQNLARQKSIVINVNIDENTLSYMILRLTILPIVENSVIHGLSGYRDDGVIKIFNETEKNILKITILDNGIGIEKEELINLIEFLNKKNMTNENQHFGLYNVNWRIKNQYGEQYGINIVSEISDFTKVIISLPLETN